MQAPLKKTCNRKMGKIRWKWEFRDHYLETGGVMNSGIITLKWGKERRES